MSVYIVKSKGEKVHFNPDKIRQALIRAGARPETIKHVIDRVTAKVKEGMTTRVVYRIVGSELRKEDRCIAHRYNLRKGLLKLGPAGFIFEKYVASILEAYGYDAVVPKDEIKGACVVHEVDGIAKRNKSIVLIEAKFRNKFEDTVTLKDAMSTWARYQDLQAGAKKGFCPAFNEVWIVTNGQFSDRAQQFSDCKGLRTVGWNSKVHSLAKMVDHEALYPITVLDELKQWELDAFTDHGYLLCRQVAKKDPILLAKSIGIPQQQATRIVRDCKDIVRVK